MKYAFYFLFLGLLAVLLSSCERDPLLYEINNLNGNVIGLYGHGGMGVKFKYPIDSYESIEPCLKKGADGTDIDIQLTKDSVLVVYHHPDLNDGTLCDGMINDKEWPEIRGCYLASLFSRKVNLQSLNDMYLKLDKYHDRVFILDCKLFTNTENIYEYECQFANAIIKFIDDNNIDLEKIYIESGDTTFLRVLQIKCNALKLFIYTNSFEEGLTIAQQMKLFGITISNDKISNNQVALAHEKGLRITLWNTKSQNEHIDAISKSPDFIQSDDIIYLLKVFGKYKK